MKFACLLSLLAVLISGCATSNPDGPPLADDSDVAQLTRAIRDLGPGVDPEEARRAARTALFHTQRLALEYQITDPPLIHNMKVNLGLRPRGLCYHWANDLGDRLQQENFRTLALHQAIANADNPFRLEHSTVIISRRGDPHVQGLVLDPWRKGGVLHWTPALADTRYDWRPREEVFERRRRLLPAQAEVARGSS